MYFNHQSLTMSPTIKKKKKTLKSETLIRKTTKLLLNIFSCSTFCSTLFHEIIFKRFFIGFLLAVSMESDPRTLFGVQWGKLSVILAQLEKLSWFDLLSVPEVLWYLRFLWGYLERCDKVRKDFWCLDSGTM